MTREKKKFVLCEAMPPEFVHDIAPNAPSLHPILKVTITINHFKVVYFIFMKTDLNEESCLTKGQVIIYNLDRT